MTLRARVVLYAVGLCSAAGVLIGASTAWLVWSSLTQETELRARTFVATVAVATTGDLASMRIEELDRVVGALAERNIESLDIRFIAVLDTDGRAVAHSEQDAYGAIANDEVSREALLSEAGIIRRTTWRAQRVLVASRPVISAVPGARGHRWGTVVAGFGIDRIGAAVGRLLLGTLALTVLALLSVALALDQLLNRRLVKPLRDLADTARRFAEGDLATRSPPPPSDGDEVAILGGAFNEMATRIEHHTHSLESDIRERTQSLAEANTRLSEANTTLEALATTDAMTDLNNYRHFRTVMLSEIRRTERTRSPFALLMIDVDHFKRWNDTLGHPEGDRALRALAGLLRSRIRRTDTAFRYGGEEFAILLVDTDQTGALLVAETIRHLVEQTPLEPDAAQRLTISVGVAIHPDHAGDLDGMVRMADEALYRAKSEGRNRVVLARPRAQAPEGGLDR